jgi:hypothetical protein
MVSVWVLVHPGPKFLKDGSMGHIELVCHLPSS